MKLFSLSFLWGFFQWFYSGKEGCGFAQFPTFGLQAWKQTCVLLSLHYDSAKETHVLSTQTAVSIAYPSNYFHADHMKNRKPCMSHRFIRHSYASSPLAAASMDLAASQVYILPSTSILALGHQPLQLMQNYVSNKKKILMMHFDYN